MKLFKSEKLTDTNKQHTSKLQSKENMIVLPIKIGLAMLDAWPGVGRLRGLSVFVGFALFSLTFQIWSVVSEFQDLDEMLKSLETVIAVISTILKVAAFQLKYRSIRYAMQDIMDVWANFKGASERKVMMNNAKLTGFILKLVIGSYSGLATSYLLYPILTYNAASYNDRRFMFQAAFPIANAKQSPIFEILTVCQLVAATFCVNGNVVVDGLLITLVLHAKTKVFNVRQGIYKFSMTCQNNRDRKTVLRAAGMLVQNHLNYIRFTESMQDIFSIVSMILVLICTTINVGIGYIFIYLLEHTSSYVRLLQCFLYISCGLIAMGSYCIAGEYLTAQSQLILEDLHNCPWYEFQPVDVRLVIFMIIKAQKPVTITVGKFSDLSLIFFTTILKTSFSYLSILRAVQQ